MLVQNEPTLHDKQTAARGQGVVMVVVVVVVRRNISKDASHTTLIMYVRNRIRKGRKLRDSTVGTRRKTHLLPQRELI